ncbi:cytosolic sulfotransferase 11-like [Solanum verrucosum]|uniref:cytosolic sulfotransferase 11-like n=1 Tax=Solanum verrucosum TaxID=315347 RepID=UPI0020D146F2|nr:cytosolic sulfotransferase 11-like [Solanum verrucosum]
MITSQTSSPTPPKYLQEDGVSEDCKKLLSTLPKEKGWIGSYIYNYQGFWTSPRLIQGVSLYGPFWNHVLDYWGKSIEKPKKVIFLMYEEIKEKPTILLKRLAEFLEFPFSIEEENCGVNDEILRMCSFDNLSNLDVNINGKLSTGEETKMLFRRGEVGDWKHYFTLEMSEKLNHIIKQKFHGSGLNFLYI